MELSLRPPLGCVPRRIWLGQRVTALAGAIGRYGQTPAAETSEEREKRYLLMWEWGMELP